MTDIVERLRACKATRQEAIVVMEEAAAEIERLRAALQACIKSAEADDPLKESGWWDEQSIVAIERARKLLGQAS